MKPIKYAIAFVIYNQDRTKFLIVQRPSDDDNLPDAWGLPAGSVKDNETFEECIIRSGKEKLGVELKPTKFIGRSNVERNNSILHMEEYEAEIESGKPKVPQPIKGMTQYQQWKWGEGSDLKDAASKGSLCSQIYLTSVNDKW
ncbi:MAG: NUDIX domain-containing protein [Candidatus Pacearchaeota archaeon]